MRRAAMPRGPVPELGLRPSSSPEAWRCVRLPARSLPFSGEFAALGLAPCASKSDVKRAYKRLALKYHPDVVRGDSGGVDREEAFKEIKSAYESLMVKFEESSTTLDVFNDELEEWDEWDEWMGFEGGMPITYKAS